MFGASNALTKWLKLELPRLPAPAGKQAGVNSLKSDGTTMCWQAHIIENQYKSFSKTIIVCEANSRFIFVFPVTYQMTIAELTDLFVIEWQAILAKTLESYLLIPRSDIILLLSKLSDIDFTVDWVKNTDLSISAHISDTAQWIEGIVEEQTSQRLSTKQAVELSVYLNTSVKRVTNKVTKQKDKFIPVERLLAYCQKLGSINEVIRPKESNVIYLSDYRGK